MRREISADDLTEVEIKSHILDRFSAEMDDEIMGWAISDYQTEAGNKDLFDRMIAVRQYLRDHAVTELVDEKSRQGGGNE